MRRLVVGGVVVLALGAGGYLARAGFLRLGAGTAAGDVPTYEVVESAFVRTVNAEGFLKPVTATPVTAPNQGRSLIIAWVAEDGTAVKKGDVVVRFDNDDASRALADGKDDEAAALIKIEKERLQINNSLNERNRTASLTKEEISKAKQLGKKDPRFFPKAEVIESEIDESLLNKRLEQTETARKVEEKLGRSRVALLAVDRQKAEIETKKARELLARLELRAPHDGTFVLQRYGWGQRVLQSGDRAYSGMRVAEVATTDKMDAEIAVLEADAGGLAPGRRATVVLDARPDVSFKAKVKKVDPFPKPKHPEVPAQYFGALLSLEGNTAGLKPGQRLQATIVLDELPKAVVIPRQAVVRKEGGTFVHRRKTLGGFELQPVKLGPGTVGRIVVTDGLTAGTVIALRDPSRSADETMEAKGNAEGGGRAAGGRESGGGRPPR